SGACEVAGGALCAPVVAAAVVLADGFDTEGIDDSKRLTERQRETQAERIRAGAIAVGLAWCEPEEVDRPNLLRATHLAIRRAVLALEGLPDLLLVDGRAVPDLPCPHRPIVKGDARPGSIGGARSG